MPLRNPFKKATGNELGQDENGAEKGFEKTLVIGSRSSALNIKGRNEEQNEYQMSGTSALCLMVFSQQRHSCSERLS
jgi:hypothetical protein